MKTTKTLDELALEHGTDKSSVYHAFTPFYERHLEPWRELPLTILEIGVLEGASARMWRDYFPAATVYGIDLLQTAQEHEEERITILIGDQTDRAFLDRVVDTAGPFDLVVDDGGHGHDQQLTSLFHLWSHVKPGGLYAIEDLHTSYLGRWGGRLGKPGTTIEELKKIVDDVNFHWHQERSALGEVESIHFYPELCVLTKRSARSRQRSGDPRKNPYLQRPILSSRGLQMSEPQHPRDPYARVRNGLGIEHYSLLEIWNQQYAHSVQTTRRADGP